MLTEDDLQKISRMIREELFMYKLADNLIFSFEKAMTSPNQMKKESKNLNQAINDYIATGDMTNLQNLVNRVEEEAEVRRQQQDKRSKMNESMDKVKEGFKQNQIF